MNAKFALALILALQVSVSLCDIQAPPEDLVVKYDQMKAVFYKRLLNAFNKLQTAATPLLEKAGENQHAETVKSYFEELQTNPEFKNAVQVATNMGQQASPLVDKARTSMLGLYAEYLRPHVGTQLDEAINYIKTVLDKVLPAE